MKKIIGFLLVLAISGSVKAQTAKGDWMVGGYFRINTSDNNTQIGLTPSVGVFLIDNLAVGGNLLLDFTKTGDNKVTNFGIGPFARYYFTNANVKPIIHGNLNFISQKLKAGSISNTNSGMNYFLGGGAAIFINDQVSIDLLAGYDHSRFDGEGSGGFAFNVGFQVYLHKSQVDKVRGSN